MEACNEFLFPWKVFDQFWISSHNDVSILINHRNYFAHNRISGMCVKYVREKEAEYISRNLILLEKLYNDVSILIT